MVEGDAVDVVDDDTADTLDDTEAGVVDDDTADVTNDEVQTDSSPSDDVEEVDEFFSQENTGLSADYVFKGAWAGADGEMDGRDVGHRSTLDRRQVVDAFREHGGASAQRHCGDRDQLVRALQARFRRNPDGFDFFQGPKKFELFGLRPPGYQYGLRCRDQWHHRRLGWCPVAMRDSGEVRRPGMASQVRTKPSFWWVVRVQSRFQRAVSR